MKRFKTMSTFKMILMILLISVTQTAAWAQDGGGVDIKVTKETSTWYTQPWVWIVGGAVFVLLLVALLRGNSKN